MWAARLLCAAHIQGSLSRCNLCRPLVGEYRNSHIDDGCDDGPDDRGQSI